MTYQSVETSGDGELALQDRPKLSSDVIEWTLRSDGSWHKRRELKFPAVHMGDAQSPPLARLFLIESVDAEMEQDISSSGLNIPTHFFKGHTGPSELASPLQTISRIDGKPNRCFFAKWLRLASHEKRIWEIEKRIESKRPWDFPSAADPAELRLDHCRYSHFSTPYREYHPVAVPGNSITHATRECASVWFDKVDKCVIGILLFDPPRRLLSCRKGYSFWKGGESESRDETSDIFPDLPAYRDLFSRLFEAVRPRTRDSTLPTCLKLIRESVTRDESSVLSALDRSLDEIDLTMSQDILIRHDLLQWKGLLSRWRNLLFHQTKSLKRLQKSIDLKTEDEFSAQLFTEILEENHTLRERVDSVAQSLMSTMSIVESERVIQQTEAVSKLTSLAFFFIPLTLVASLFGMNVVEFEDKLTAGIWIACSAGATITTYFILYRREVFHGISRAPALIQSLSIRRLSGLAIRWVRILQRWWIPMLVTNCLVVGFGIMIWQLAEGNLPVGAKVGIALGCVSLLGTAFAMWFRIRRFHNPLNLARSLYPP